MILFQIGLLLVKFICSLWLQHSPRHAAGSIAVACVGLTGMLYIYRMYCCMHNVMYVLALFL